MSDRETRARIMRKFLRESNKPLAIGAFWRYVQTVAREHRFRDGFVEWDQVLSEVNDELAKEEGYDQGDEPQGAPNPHTGSAFESAFTPAELAEIRPQGAPACCADNLAGLTRSCVVAQQEARGVPLKCEYHPIYRECARCGGAMNRGDDLECPEPNAKELAQAPTRATRGRPV